MNDDAEEKAREIVTRLHKQAIVSIGLVLLVAVTLIILERRV